MLHFSKISLEYSGVFLISYWGISRDPWNLKFFPKYFSKRKRGIIFHSWKFPSNSLLTHEHCRLAILDGMSTSFKPPLSQLLIRVFPLIFGLLWFQINSLCILFSWVIVELDKTVTEARFIILVIANVLKIEIFPSRVNFSSFRFSKQSLFSVYDLWNSFHFQVFSCKNNELREFLLCFFYD